MKSWISRPATWRDGAEMKRADVEKAFDKNEDIETAIQLINAALEEAAIKIMHTDPDADLSEAIRALKIDAV